MKRRIELSNTAMKSIEKIKPTRKINITKKLKTYKTIVESVLTYNMSTWGLTKNKTEEIDRLHREQLRQVWNDKNKKNKDLYKESNERPISEEMKKARWKSIRTHAETS